MASITIKQHDTARKIADTLLAGGVAISLTGATVSFVLRNTVSGVVWKRTATVTDAAAGKVEYQLVAEDTAAAAMFDVEWEIVFSGSLPLTVPDDSYHTLIVMADLG